MRRAPDPVNENPHIRRSERERPSLCALRVVTAVSAHVLPVAAGGAVTAALCAHEPGNPAPAERRRPRTGRPRPYSGGVSDLAQAHRLALALPEVTEEPHFDMASFRVRGKIFVTVPPEGTRLHVFIDPLEVEGYVAQDPGCDVRVTPPPAFSSMWRKRLARRSCQVRSFRPWAPPLQPA